jgi:TP901 family phage tail tape measure protein
MTRRSIEAGKAVIVIDILDKANASFSKLTSKMMASARGLRNLGQQAAGAGLLTGLVSRNVINNFVEFEDKILNLTAKLGIFGVETNKQKASIKDLTKTIIDLGRVTSYTSAEVADAAISLAQAGFSITEIKSSLKSVLDLARGTNYALGESADLLANTIRTYNLFKPGDSAEILAENMSTINHVSSMMVKATRLGTIEIQDLRESMKYASGTSVNLGANLSTVLGLLVQMSESGLKASLAGTSMNTAFLNLAGNLETLQGRLPKFQLFMSTLQDGTKGVDFGQTLKSLMDATKGMDRLERVKIFQDVFNIRGARMISSVQEMERVEFFIREIAAAGEEAALAAAKMESGLGGAIRRLTSGLEALNIAAGYTFKDGATAMANFATVGVAALEKLTASHKLLVGALVFSPVIFVGIAASAMILSVVLARLRTVLIGLGAAFNGLKRFGGFLGGSLKNTGGMIAGLMNSRKIKAGLIKKQAEKVAKMEAKINASVAIAQAKKTPAAQASALARINASKKMATFKAEQAKLAQMTKRANPIAAAKSAGSAIAGKASALNTVRKERADIKSQIKLEGALQKKNLRDTIAAQKAVIAQFPDVEKRVNRILMLDERRLKNNRTLVKLIAARSSMMNEVKGAVALENAIDKAYDRLYAVRQALKSTPTLIKGQGGVPKTNMAFLKLAAEEKQLATFINKNQAQAAFKKVHAQKQVARIQQTMDKGFKTNKALSNSIAVQKAQISSGKKLAVIEAKRARAAAGAQGMANAAASQKRVAAAGRAMKDASYMKTLFSGANMTKTFATMGKGVSMIFNLSKSFAVLTFRLSRFVFSWNFVGLALNALLLFGHKIPFIRKAFEDVGAGFSAAFQQIGRIATYAAPALRLFSLAFEAFVKGDTGVGVAAISAGFSGLVSIIQNQLSAAWNAFAAKVSSIYITFKAIFVTVWSIVDALVKGLGGAFDSLLSPIFDAVGGLFDGKGNFADSLKQVFLTLVLSLNNFITNFFGAISKLVTWGKQFAGEVKIAIGLAFLNVPGMKNAGLAAINQGTQDTFTATNEDKARQDQIKKESKTREDAIQKAFFDSAKAFSGNKNNQVVSLNAASQKLSEEMSNIATDLSYQLRTNKMMSDIETQRLKDLQNRNQSVPGTAAPNAAMKSFEYKLATLVGSIQAVSGNRLLKESPKELEVAQETNAKLDTLIQVVKTQGM